MLLYRGAENWDDGESHAKYPHKYFQLNVDVNRIEFDHHWLFSPEDSLAREVKNLYDDYVTSGEHVLRLLKEYMEFQQTFELRQQADDGSLSEEMERRRSDLANEQRDYVQLGQLLEDAWLKLQEIRRTSGTRSTDVFLERVEGMPNEYVSTAANMHLSE